MDNWLLFVVDFNTKIIELDMIICYSYYLYELIIVLSDKMCLVLVCNKDHRLSTSSSGGGGGGGCTCE